MDDGREATSLASSRASLTMPDPPAGALGWSLADLTVAGGVVLAVSMLLFPALRDSRDGTRRNVCQNNQRQLWLLVANYAQNHGGYVPQVKPNENAGIFAVRLVERGYITADDLALLLVCPGAPLADAVRSGQFAIQIPTSAQLAAMSAERIGRGQDEDVAVHCLSLSVPRRARTTITFATSRQSFSPLFSDTSGAEQDGLMSPNHGGSIVQVTYQDGSLKSLTSCTLPGLNDDLFRNSLGLVAAGLSRQDSVLGRSEATPEIVAAQV